MDNTVYCMSSVPSKTSLQSEKQRHSLYSDMPDRYLASLKMIGCCTSVEGETERDGEREGGTDRKREVEQERGGGR